jgi:glycosyltransferase involved in cell wall biosynthesis
MSTKKVLFLIPSMAGGGAERVFSLLVRNINTKKWQPVLGLLQAKGPFLNTIPASVRIVDLDCSQSRYALLKIVRLVWKERPHVVCSTLGYLNLLTLCIRIFFPRSVRIVIRESTFVSESLKLERYGRFFSVLYRWLYRKADGIVCLSKAMQRDLLTQIAKPLAHVFVIPNPVETDNILKLIESEPKLPIAASKTHRTLVSIGRLEIEKGHDILLDAVSRLGDSVRVLLVGSGTQEQQLNRQAMDLGIESRVVFLGFQENPFAYLKYADLFVFPSRYEGFGNAMIEALAAGVPVVTFSGPTAGAEVIQPGINGILADSVDSRVLADAINAGLHTSFDHKAIKKSARKNYDIESITCKYEEVFENVTKS